MSEGNGLPPGWAWSTVAQVGHDSEQTVLTGPFGSNLGHEDFVDAGVPVLTIGCLTQHGLSLAKALFVDNAKANGLGRYRVREGDVLFSRMASVGRAEVVTAQFNGALINYHLMRLRLADEAVSPRYFVYYVRGSEAVKSYVRDVNHGATRDGINTSQLLDMPILVPPLAEQQRIVAAIEQQFSRLDASVAALRRVQAALKRYRAAVLKSAVEGTLTEEWRAEHPNVEPASALLPRILAERRALWEADLRAKGKDPAKMQYQEPAAPDTAGLLELPEGWCWATVDQVGAVIGGVTKGRDLTDRPSTTLPYLRVANVQRGFLDLREIKTIEVPHDEIERYLLHEGDVVLTEGGDADKLGRAAIWQGQVDQCIHQNHIFRARIVDPDMPPQWLVFYANSDQGRAYFLDAAKQTVNLASINLTQLRNCPVPLPPLPEQEQIVAEVERRLSVVSELETAIEANLKRAERLRTSILERAFSGQLVSQDANDESASVLLERIRAERARSGKPTQLTLALIQPGKSV